MAASPSRAGRDTSTAPTLPDDWPAQAAERIESVVGTVRDKTTGPIDKAAQWAVYGLLAAVLGITALVLLVVGMVRLINVYLPDAWVGEQHMWAAHLVVGLPFTLLGLFLLRRARR